MTAAKAVKATFNGPVLTVAKTGTGAGMISGSGLNCGTLCATAYNPNTKVLLTAKEAAGSIFAGWIGICAVSSTDPRQCTATLNQSLTVTARFNSTTTGKTAPALYKTGPGLGSVTSVPAGISCAPACSASVGYFETGVTVTLTASPAAGSIFAGWSGGCTANPANPRQCTASLTTGKVVIARFARPVLTVRKTGSGLVTSAWPKTLKLRRLG